MENYNNPQQEIITPVNNQETGKPYASKKFSITILDLAEGYKPNYKTYWWVVRKKDLSFVCKAKDRNHAEQIIKNCKCQDVWRAEGQTEHEELLTARSNVNKGQYQGTHKVLDVQQRYKAKELDFDRERLTEQNRIVKTRELITRKNEIRKTIGINGLRQDIKERAGNNLPTYEDREVLTSILVEDAKRQLFKEFLL